MNRQLNDLLEDSEVSIVLKSDKNTFQLFLENDNGNHCYGFIFRRNQVNEVLDVLRAKAVDKRKEYQELTPYEAALASLFLRDYFSRNLTEFNRDI